MPAKAGTHASFNNQSWVDRDLSRQQRGSTCIAYVVYAETGVDGRLRGHDGIGRVETLELKRRR
jgi:hypothetical protein